MSMKVVGSPKVAVVGKKTAVNGAVVGVPAISVAEKVTAVPAADVTSAKKRVSGLDLAYQVLVESGKPMNQRQIAEAVIARGWETKGKTPGATLYVNITAEIKKKGNASRFARADGVKGSFVAVSAA